MCELCDREGHEFEAPTPDAVALSALLTEEDHWNAFHIVVEDGNVEDDHVASCEGRLTSDRERKVFALLSKLSEEQRLTAIALHLGILPSTASGSELAEHEHRDGPAKPAAKP